MSRVRLVACLAALLLGAPIKTFTGGFRDGPEYDETPYARLVAKHIDSEHHEIFPTADDFVETLPSLIYAMDEPAGHSVQQTNKFVRT